MFDKIEKILYNYQKDVVEIVLKNDKGVIVMPTGTGKTFVQAAILAKTIIENKNKFGIYVINAPRIMLSYQLMKEVYKFLTSNEFGLNIEARYFGVHSGRLDGADEDFELIRSETNIPFSEINASTSTLELKKIIKKARKQDLPLVLFSTYHSSTRIEEARKGLVKDIELVLNDEAHYLVSNQFHDNIDILKTKKQFFFTATTKITASDSGQGMNNVDVFGEEIFKMTPREAIELGKMIRPRLHFVKSNQSITKENLDKNIGKLISESFREHDYIINNLVPKMMVTVNGSKDMHNFMDSSEYDILIGSGVNIYMVHSNSDIGNMINGEQYSRLDWLTKLKEDGANPDKRLIVMHYNIITEGIDVPGLTGVLLLRSLKKSSFIQTFGRVARVQEFDKKRIDSGKILPTELKKMLKPFSYIILPSIIAEDMDNIEYLSNLIYSLREFDFNTSEDIVITETTANGLPEPIDGGDALISIKKRLPNIDVILEKLEAEYEDELLASLSTTEEILDFFNEKL